MIRAVYRFRVYYHVRRVLKGLQVPLPHETGFNAADNPYTESDFLKFARILGFLMILSNIRTKNFIGLISMALVGPMIKFVQIQ